MTQAPFRPRKTIGWLFLLAFATGFSGAIMPGPLLAAVIGQTTAQGFRAVIGLITGHALLELVTVILLVAGLQMVLERPRVRGAIGLVGGAALVWMGWDMLHQASAQSLDLDAAAADVWSWPKLLFLGAAVCAANPYFTGWWATIGAGQLAHMAPRTVAEYAAFYLGHEASDYTWYALVGLLLLKFRPWLAGNQHIYHGLIYVCGLIVAALGLWFVYTGIRFVSGKVKPRSETEPMAVATEPDAEE